MISKDELKRLEKLAKLRFDQDELEKFNAQLNDILDYMKELDEIDFSGVDILLNPLQRQSFFREDKIEKAFCVTDLLKNAPDIQDDYFKVPKVI